MWKKKWKRGRSGNKMSYKKKISWIHVDMKIVIWLLMSWKWRISALSNYSTLKYNAHAQNLHGYVSLHICKYTRVCKKSHE